VNHTLVTATLSLAFAAKGTAPETMAAGVGAEMETDGAAESLVAAFCTTINIGGIGVGVVVDNVEIAYGNDGCPNDPGFESGGSKFVRTDSLVVRNSFVHHNCGVGLWLDINNINYTLENNRVEDNVRDGIAIEISYRGVIRNNTVRRNGNATDPYRGQNWLWDAGIGIHASSDVEIYGNTVEDNFNGIVAIQQNRGSAYNDPAQQYGPYLVQNLYVHDNVIKQNMQQRAGMANAAAGIVQDVVDNAVFTSRNNRYQNNTYYLLPLGGGQSPGFEWMGWKSDSQWKGYGLDTTSRFNRW
jgi:parallel beta-helix repeat protein